MQRRWQSLQMAAEQRNQPAAGAAAPAKPSWALPFSSGAGVEAKAPQEALQSAKGTSPAKARPGLASRASPQRPLLGASAWLQHPPGWLCSEAKSVVMVGCQRDRCKIHLPPEQPQQLIRSLLERVHPLMGLLMLEGTRALSKQNKQDCLC